MLSFPFQRSQVFVGNNARKGHLRNFGPWTLHIFPQNRQWEEGWTDNSLLERTLKRHTKLQIQQPSCRYRACFMEESLSKRCILSSLAANGWIAEEAERWDRTSACKGALLQPLQSMFESQLAHPDQCRHKSDRPWNRGLHPLLVSNNVTGSFTSPSNWSTRMKTRPTAYCHRPMTRSSELRKGFHSDHDLTSFLQSLVDGPAGVWTQDLLLSRPALFQLS